MSLRDGPFSEMRPPLAWLAVATIALTAVVSLALFVSDRRPDPPEANRAARRALDGSMSTATGALSAPVRWVGDVVDAGRGYLLSGVENRRLRQELAAAQSWKDQAIALRLENERYRALLGVRTEPPLPRVVARTVLDARGPFANTRLADMGSDSGITEGNPVMSEHGLVGRVVGLAARVSRVMLLTDVESRTPVLIANTNGRAILAGDGGGNPRLDYVRTHDPLRPGDRILTSGDGGVLPRGLPVGTVVKAYDGGWRVALDADAAPIDYVEILLFKDFSQLAPAADLAPKTLPTVATAMPTVAASPMAVAQPAKPGAANANPKISGNASKPSGARP